MELELKNYLYSTNWINNIWKKEIIFHLVISSLQLYNNLEKNKSIVNYSLIDESLSNPDVLVKKLKHI